MIKIPTSASYSKNYAGHSGEHEPCCVCGKAVKAPRHYLHMHCGGSHAVTEAEAATLPDNADLGMQPVGADCLRKHPELRPYVTR